MKPALTLACAITIHSPGIQCHAASGEEAGNKPVPDPIANIERNGPPVTVRIIEAIESTAECAAGSLVV